MLFSITHLDLPDEYEEDFLSTDSSNPVEENSKSKSVSLKSSNKQGALSIDKLTGKKLGKGSADKETEDKAANSPIGSISEDLEEDTNSGLDDLLNSTSTVSITIVYCHSYVCLQCVSIEPELVEARMFWHSDLCSFKFLQVAFFSSSRITLLMIPFHTFEVILLIILKNYDLFVLLGQYRISLHVRDV